jgi:hypothetical protein
MYIDKNFVLHWWIPVNCLVNVDVLGTSVYVFKGVLVFFAVLCLYSLVIWDVSCSLEHFFLVQIMRICFFISTSNLAYEFLNRYAENILIITSTRCTYLLTISPPAVTNAMSLWVSGVSEPCEKFPHTVDNLWPTELICVHFFFFFESTECTVRLFEL